MLAGQIATARGIEMALHAMNRAGGSPAKRRAAAEKVLRRNFSAATTNSINAIINRAEESIQVGYRQNRGGANYTPPRGIIPDVREIQRIANSTGSGTVGDRPDAVYYHQAVVTIRDPNRPDRGGQSYSITVPRPGLLTNAEMDAEFHRRAESFFQRFLQYDEARLSQQQLEFSLTRMGVYIGY